MQRHLIRATILLAALLSTACQPRPQLNALGYQVADRLGTLHANTVARQTGAIVGRVTWDDKPAAGVHVLVAERTGAPHATRTDRHGEYRLRGIPPGHYVIGAVGSGYQERAMRDDLGVPRLLEVLPGSEIDAGTLAMQPHQQRTLPTDLAAAFAPQLRTVYTATAAFPTGSTADVMVFQYSRAGIVNDSLRLYLPPGTHDLSDQPLLLATYPGVVDNWESVSVALAAQGYPSVAHAPLPQWGVDVDEHAYDAQIALSLARAGELSPRLAGNRVIAMGGSFSSAILNRMFRESAQEIAGWITVGGISNAFSGTHDFYNDALTIPAEYALLIPALGPPHIYPQTFLRYSPVFTAAELPPTLIIHTAADDIIPIAQAYELEDALIEAGIPVEVFYYDDVSHYLQIDENMTDAGQEMFYRIVTFVERFGNQ